MIFSKVILGHFSFKGKAFFWLFLLLYSFSILKELNAKIVIYSLEEKVHNADLILIAELVKVKGTTKVSIPWHRNNSPNRYAEFKVKRILKGKYNKKTLVLDYEKTNKKYFPFVCRPPASPPKEKNVILFLEKGMTLFAGYQGQIPLLGTKENIKIINKTRWYNIKGKYENLKRAISAYVDKSYILKKLANR